MAPVDKDEYIRQMKSKLFSQLKLKLQFQSQGAAVDLHTIDIS